MLVTTFKIHRRQSKRGQALSEGHEADRLTLSPIIRSASFSNNLYRYLCPIDSPRLFWRNRNSSAHPNEPLQTLWGAPEGSLERRVRSPTMTTATIRRGDVMATQKRQGLFAQTNSGAIPPERRTNRPLTERHGHEEWRQRIEEDWQNHLETLQQYLCECFARISS